MEITTLKLFLAVAKRRSFAAVARDYNQDPSTISRAVANLETELGIRLFQRTTRNMTLTEAGEIYFNRMETLLEYLDNANEEAQATSTRPRGILRMTSSVAFGQVCITPLLPRLREEFPHLKFELHLADERVDLVANRIDLAIRLGHRIDGDVIAAKLINTRYRVCASPDYLEQHGSIDHPAVLSRHRCLLFRIPSFNSTWIACDASGEEVIIPVDGDIVISSVQALHQCALNGLGPVLLADWMVDDDIRSGRLIDVLPGYTMSGAHSQTAAWLVYPSRRYLPYKVRVMVDFLKTAFAERSLAPPEE